MSILNKIDDLLWHVNNATKRIVQTKVDRQTAIIKIMALLPVNQSTGRRYYYNEVDRALKKADINLELLYHDLALGYPTVTTAQFYAALHMFVHQR